MQTFLLYYLAIGALIFCTRVGYDLCSRLAASARGIAAKNNISMLRATSTLIGCGIALVAMVIVCWPWAVARYLSKGASK